jgi:1,4-dihydroxy-2-naphthoate octaprenyltransferase
MVAYTPTLTGTASPRTSARVAAFVRLGRPKFLLNSSLMVGLGVAMASYLGHPVRVGAMVLALAFAWCTHLMTHYCNEYFDLEADRANPAPTGMTGGSRILADGTLAPEVALAAAFTLLFVDVLLIVLMPAPVARAMAFGCVAVGWFYTAPPLRLNYRSLGEVGAASGLNLLLPLLSCYLQIRSAPGQLLAIVSILLLVQVARMIVMNLADSEGDRLAGKRTLVGTLGARSAARVVGGAELLAYLAVAAMLLTGVLPPVAGLAMLATGALSARLVRALLGAATADPAGPGRLARLASIHVSSVGFAATAGLLVEYAVRHGYSPSMVPAATLTAIYAALLPMQYRRRR